jgi:hypothetical protein
MGSVSQVSLLVQVEQGPVWTSAVLTLPLVPQSDLHSWCQKLTSLQLGGQTPGHNPFNYPQITILSTAFDIRLCLELSSTGSHLLIPCPVPHGPRRGLEVLASSSSIACLPSLSPCENLLCSPLPSRSPLLDFAHGPQWPPQWSQ